ncbi:hypothetical protein B7P43_G11332 [Cryptotermes secundus]|uniref:Uncharacterized protein n=1 Tax=Cryptotermes secundus TaxID=105785 RepID=A0A2J7RQ58_9NEOP|nr:hypothetical protein B7P43_G11332 [Cryptotermes secundus]
MVFRTPVNGLDDLKTRISNAISAIPADMLHRTRQELEYRMKRDMKGKRFADVAEVNEKTTEALSSISKDEFRQCFEKWNKRLDKCISVSGEYFEGD